MKTFKLLGASLAVLAVVACESGEEKAEKFTDNAQQYLDEGQLKRARIQFQNALKNDPNNAEALRGAAEVAEINESYGDQLRYLERLSGLEPDDLEIVAKIARLNLLGGRPDVALRRADRVLEAQPDNIDALTVKGAAQVLQNNLDGASETLERALSSAPDNVEVRNLLAARYVRDEDYTKANEIIDTGLADDPANEALLVVKLLLTQRRQDVGGMDETLQALIAASPDNGFYRERYAAFLLAAKGDLDGARSQLEAAIPLLEDRTDAVGRLVGIVRRREGDEAGEAKLKEIVGNYPGDDELLFAMPAYLCETGQNERCQAELERLASADDVPSDVRYKANVQIGESDFRNEDLDAALARAEGVLAQDDTEPNALTLKGKVQLARDEVSEAIETLRAALASEQDKESAQILLGLAYEASGRADFGESQLAQAIDKNGLSPALFQAYRGMLARNGKQDDAADLTLEFAQTSNATPQVQRESAAVLIAQRRPEEAEIVARNLIRADGSDQVARRILATAQLAQGQTEAALGTLNEMDESQNKSLAALQLRSQALAQLERFEELRGVLREAGEENGLVEGFVLLSQLEQSQGDLTAAENVVLQGLEAYPAQEPLYLSLYNVRLAKGNGTAASQALLDGIAEAESTANLRVLRSNELLQRNDRVGAKIVLQSLKDDNLLNDLSANNLAAVMMDLGEDAAEALQIAERFADTEQPFFADTLAWAHYNNGNLEDARKYAAIAAEAEQINAEILYHRGVIAAASGDTEEARASLKRALSAPGKSDIVNDEVIQTALDELELSADR